MIKRRNEELFWPIVNFGILLLSTFIFLLPDLDVSTRIIALPATILPFLIITDSVLGGKYFTILTIYSSIYLLECLGGIIASAAIGNNIIIKTVSVSNLFDVVSVYFFGYIAFLVGYYVTYRRYMIRFSKMHSSPFTYRFASQYWIFLFMIICIFIACSFVTLFQRIQTAGGLKLYISTMYQYRFGTFTEDSQSNALVVLANILGSLSLPFVSVGFILTRVNPIYRKYKNIIYFFMSIIFFQAFLTNFRSVMFFTVLNFVMIYDHIYHIKLKKFARWSLILLCFLLVINFYHQYMYYKTAGWEYTGIVESIGKLISPHGHLATLDSVLLAAESSHIGGEGIFESVFFFIPRFLWKSKLDTYGTKLIQSWAGLPTWYQIAVTNVGELVAHFGKIGIFGMVFYGALHGVLETFRYRVVPLQAFLFGVVIPRLLGHLGMGISAVAITLWELAIFYLITRLIKIVPMKTTSAIKIGSSELSRT